MYALEAFLSLVVAVLAYVNGVLRGRRAVGGACSSSDARADGLHAQLGALLLRRARRRDGRVRARPPAHCSGSSCAGVALLYAPWLPTLLSQARAHRRAVVDDAELPRALRSRPGTVLGGDASFVALVLVGGGGARRRRTRGDATSGRSCSRCSCRRRHDRSPRGVASQISPAWTARYFAVVLGPVVLARGRGDRARAAARRWSRSSSSLFLWWGFSRQGRQGERASEITARLAPYAAAAASSSSRRTRSRCRCCATTSARATAGRRRSARCRTRRSSTGATPSTGSKAARAQADARRACSRPCRAAASSSSSRRSSATTARGAPSGRGSSGGSRIGLDVAARSAIRACSSCAHIVTRRDRGQARTTSSRSRRSSIAAVG